MPRLSKIRNLPLSPKVCDLLLLSATLSTGVTLTIGTCEGVDTGVVQQEQVHLSLELLEELGVDVLCDPVGLLLSVCIGLPLLHLLDHPDQVLVASLVVR